MRFRFLPCILLLSALLSAQALAADAPSSELPYTPSLDPAALDRSADPCEDLYRFSCGGWIAQNPIPGDRGRYSVYEKLYEDNQKYLWGLLQDASEPSPSRSATAQKIGDYFAACMDVEAIERAGAAPLQGDLERIDSATSTRDLGRIVGSLHARLATLGLFFAGVVEQDAKESSKVIAAVYAAGLGLPDRDFYFEEDDKSKETRAKYLEHVQKMFELTGEGPEIAARHAATVMRIETSLAKASLTRVERRDPYKVYHRTTPKDLTKLVPSFDWDAYFQAVGAKPGAWLNVSEPAFFREVEKRLKKESLDDLKTYLRWGLVNAQAEYLSAPFVDQDFAFYRAHLRGITEDEPRWKKCVDWVDRDLGEALGKEFVDRVFPGETKGKAVEMTKLVEHAMSARIDALDWMSPKTKEAAKQKLSKMRNKVGYPDRWRDYSTLTIQRDDFYGNVERGSEFENRRQVAKIGKPVDRGEWGMTPPTVNAYYNASMNDINFPAGVLMPPLFDAGLDDAPNYGNTGSTIGHELTHGFDDEGRLFDGDGNLRDWWTKKDASAFEKRANCIRDQYSQYVVVDEITINGQLSSGEDIADLGGTILAYEAWKEATKGLSLESRDGLTPEQRFFVGFAQWACENQRPEDLRLMAATNPHSPGKYRINGVVVNMPEFAKAFQCGPDAALVKKAEKVCRIW